MNEKDVSITCIIYALFISRHGSIHDTTEHMPRNVGAGLSVYLSMRRLHNLKCITTVIFRCKQVPGFTCCNQSQPFVSFMFFFLGGGLNPRLVYNSSRFKLRLILNPAPNNKLISIVLSDGYSRLVYRAKQSDHKSISFITAIPRPSPAYLSLHSSLILLYPTFLSDTV